MTADMAGLDGLIERLKDADIYSGDSCYWEVDAEKADALCEEAATQLQALAQRVKVLEAENERLRRDDWFEQFEEQEQLRDNAEQRLSIVEAENERLRKVLMRWQYSGCPDCSGDCGSANPPVLSCIMLETSAALKGTEG